MSSFQPDQTQGRDIEETPYLVRGGDPDRGSVPQKPAPPGLLLVQVVKDGALLITAKEKIIYHSTKLPHSDKPEIVTQIARILHKRSRPEKGPNGAQWEYSYP